MTVRRSTAYSCDQDDGGTYEQQNQKTCKLVLLSETESERGVE